MRQQSGPVDDGDRLPHALQNLQELIDVRSRSGARTVRADRLTALALGLGYSAVAVGCALTSRGVGWPDVGVAVPLIVLYVIAYRTEFAATSGSAVPTEPILIAMLLLLPLSIVPLVVLVALQFGGVGALRTARSGYATFVQCATGWHCLGPVAVLAVAGPLQPSLAHAPVYLIALLAQFAVDALVAATRTWSLGVPQQRLIKPLAWTFATDAVLAPTGLCIVISGGRSLASIMLLTAPIALVRLLAHDRSEHLQTAVNLSSAFTAVREEARVDPLTGLANRRAWEEALAAAQGRIDQGTAAVATVIAADVDGLKVVNDTHGHEAGDALIVAIADVLRQAVPQAASTARLGGDEFGVLVIGESDGHDPHELIKAIRNEMQRHRRPDGGVLSASLGVSASPPEASVQDAARVADQRAGEDKVTRRAGRT